MNDKELLIQLGSRIREIRKSKNLTLKELASKCGMYGNYIGMIEHGEKNPSYTTLVKIAEGCGVKIEKLVKE